MADELDTLAVQLNEDAKAARRKPRSKPVTEADPEPEPTESNAGVHEAQHEANLETLEAIAEEFMIDRRSMGTLIADLRDAMIEVFKHRQRPWGQLSATEQRDVATALEYGAKSFVRHALVAIASEGRPSIRCKLDGYGEKDGVKVNLSLSGMPPEEMGAAIILLHGAVKKEVLIITADAEAYNGPRKAEIQPDDPELEFPDDNSDLADAADLDF